MTKLNSIGIAKEPKDTLVVVAMSGGVDSSTVAAMMKNEGYKVIGITLKLYNDTKETAQSKQCCSGQDIMDAKRVADKLKIEHKILYYQNKFKEGVIDNFIDSYLKGETPIPCVQCNKTVKFTDLFEEAKRLKEFYGVAKSSALKEEKLIDFTQATNKEEHQLSSLQLSEVIEEAYREILLALKNQLKHHNLDTIIKSGFVLCGGGAQVISCEELVRDFFTRRAKIGTIPDSRIFGLDNILTDFRYAGSIGLLLHEDDLKQDVDFISNVNNGFMDKLKKLTA